MRFDRTVAVRQVELTSSVAGCGGQTTPSDRASEAQLIEMGRVVIRDATSQHKPFPGICGNFEALQLADDFQRAVLTAHLCSRSNMLPSQQPVHELRGCDRFNLLAQGRDRQPMNPRQQPAFAPLDFKWRGHAVALQR